jgi:hypothetical protein
MKLYFENSYGEERIIAEVANEKEAFKEIHKFCEERNFKIYYTRSWKTKSGRTKYDVGSHTEFFYLATNE